MAVSLFDPLECESPLETAEQQTSLANTILSTVTTLVLVLNRAGHILYLNPFAEALTGYCTHDLVARPIWETLLLPHDAKHVQALFANLQTQGFPEQDENYLVIRDGSKKRVAWNNATHTNNAGKIDYVIKTGVDMTEQRALEKRLLLVTTALESAANAVIITNREGRIEWINAAFTRLTGYTANEITGRTTRILKTPHHSPSYYAQLWKTILSGQIWEGEFINRRKDGSIYIAEQIITPVMDDVGAIAHFIGIQHDVTQRKENETMLQRYTQELEARNEDLDAFAHTVAHDLKTPLALINGYAELLLDEQINIPLKNLHNSLEIIVRSGKKMNNIINELLLLASTRKSEVTPQPLDMFEIMREVLFRLQFLIEEKQAEIHLPNTWPIALGYAAWVEEAWVNYLSNALKYGGPQPRVELGYTILDSESWLLNTGNSVLSNQLPVTTIKFWVRDYGPGIPVEQQRNLFKPFTQLGQVRAQGHGLGLSIVRRIVEKLGGQVSVESIMGEGSTFSFTLPLAGEIPGD